MNLTSDRIRSIGWVSALVICGAVTVGLTLRVNAETEFQTRSNQQALSDLNELEFGYKAPTAAQYIEGERQLAALGVPAGPGAPAPIRYANADAPGSAAGEGSLLAMVSPVAGATAAALAESSKATAASRDDGRDPERAALARDAAALSKRLAHIEVAEAAKQ
jgi:hypothetical protein